MGGFLALLLLATPTPPPIIVGPMVGYGTHHEVMIWARTLEPTSIAVRYWAVDEPTQKRTTPTQETAGEDGRVAHIRLQELTPGTHYGFEMLVGDPLVVSAAKHPLRFQTQALWHRRAEPPPFTFAFGSCLYLNDPLYESPKLPPYGGGYEIFESIRAQSPDLMLWLGDNVYLRPTDWSSRGGIFRRYARERPFAPLQGLLGSTHNYAVWDDHDYGPNDADWTYVHKGAALDAFREYWANPSYGLPDTPGVFGQFTWADVDFFLVDVRYYRSSSRAPRTPTKTLLGERQFSWLMDSLTSSKAPFKVVIGGGQFLSPFDHFEGYAQYPHEQRRLIDTLVKRGVEGVLFLSGDRHHSELVRIKRKGFYPLYDFTSSPLGSRGAKADKERKSRVRVPGTLIHSRRSFGMIRVDGPGKDRVMTLEARDTGGELIWQHQIRARELRVPKAR